MSSHLDKFWRLVVKLRLKSLVRLLCPNVEGNIEPAVFHRTAPAKLKKFL